MASKGFTVPDIRKMEIKDVLLHVENAVEFLKDADHYNSTEVEDVLKFLKDARKFDKIGSIPKAATQHGLGEVYVKMAKPLEDHFMSQEKTQGTINLDRLESVIMNYANSCPDLGCELGKSGAISYIVTLLNRLIKLPDNERTCRRMDYLLGILHNAIHHKECSVNRLVFRKAGAVKTLKKYLDSTRMLTKLSSLLILAYIVNEKESKVLGRGDEAVVFLIGMLKEGVFDSDHKAHVANADMVSSFTVFEILDGLNYLSINDANKKAVLENGGIPVINRILTSDFSIDEKRLAARSLWRLAFDETVRESDEMKESLKALEPLTSSKDMSLRAASKNVLWQIEGNSRIEKKQTKAKRNDDGGHIMISYNWKHQERAVQIKDELERAGYKVWIDVDKMEDDILDSMADAVMKSEVVLMCISRSYHASQSCRSEATYAYKKNKPVIPLLVQEDYEPEGWLDILIGTKLYYKVYSEREVQTNISEIKKAIGRRGLQLPEAVEDKGPVEAKPVGSENVAKPSVESNASTWSTERVQQWFEEIQLPQLKSPLDFCDGSDLEDLYNKYSRDASAFENDCKTNFELEFRDILRLSSALKKLFR